MSCQLQTGKTVLDLTAWWARWRSISDKAGFKDYKVKVGCLTHLLPIKV